MSDEIEKVNEPEGNTKTKSPFQFSIKSLIILTAAVAVFFALARLAPAEVTLLAAVAAVMAAVGKYMFNDFVAVCLGGVGGLFILYPDKYGFWGVSLGFSIGIIIVVLPIHKKQKEHRSTEKSKPSTLRRFIIELVLVLFSAPALATVIWALIVFTSDYYLTNHERFEELPAILSIGVFVGIVSVIILVVLRLHDNSKKDLLDKEQSDVNEYDNVE